jgi:hypothetical protein
MKSASDNAGVQRLAAPATGLMHSSGAMTMRAYKREIPVKLNHDHPFYMENWQ